MRWKKNGSTRPALIAVLGAGLVLACLNARASAHHANSNGNRLAYLDSPDPYYVSRDFPRLTTPQWVGEPGVEAVVILAIDDLREPARYEQFLRPILKRLKQIDGRAPVSIMTCNVKPDDPQLAAWLAEGLSIDVHTIDHPCPLLGKQGFAFAKGTYDRCVDLLNTVPGNRPVAFRMPCCDSLNTVSPRFYAEIFNKTTAAGHFLAASSSVFNVFTADDPGIPRALVIDEEGKDRFKKYVPYDRSFVNTVENYPYPYVINGLCWEFPCVAPSDWSAQHHYNQKGSPKTVRDWKAALDITVLKQGTMNLVFHPHGWIESSQIVELIDHAVSRHGGKVKFLTFAEAVARLNAHLLAGGSLRAANGGDNGARLLDVNNDGWIDVVLGNGPLQLTRIWQPKESVWRTLDFPVQIVGTGDDNKSNNAGRIHFGVLNNDGNASVIVAQSGARPASAWHFDGSRWKSDDVLASLPVSETVPRIAATAAAERVPAAATTEEQQLFVRDLDGDGVCEIVRGDKSTGKNTIFSRQLEEDDWKSLPWSFTNEVAKAFFSDSPQSVRFVDVDEDGHDDLIFSDVREYAVRLFNTRETGYTRQALAGLRGKKESKNELPMLVRADGSDNGFFTHSRKLWWQNEDTAAMPDLVDRLAMSDLVQQRPPGPKTPDAAVKSMVVRPGFQVELVAGEPLVMDPVAFDWGPDGRLWVAEMADYPIGVTGNEKPGGRVRYLEDTNGDGRYDRSTLFLDRLNFPNGVMPWKNGVLISAAPDILYAEDTNGDGRADRTDVLYAGFGQGNQQHRVNGFAWGLDNWVYLANGDSGGQVRSQRTGKTLALGSSDLRIRPDTGDIEPRLGSTQFQRARDDWGNWFGNNNSNPMFHYVLDAQNVHGRKVAVEVRTNENFSRFRSSPRCYPVSRTLDRFNDFDNAGRFTSACSAIVYRDDLFGEEFADNWFVSEPVHNLVHRQILTPDGETFTSRRANDERESEFLASRDNWFRPTMLKVGPDGALYIADMYRAVIEHVQYIPRELQKGLDVRAGDKQGRIYRVFPRETPPRTVPRYDRMNTKELVGALDSASGWQRDMAQRLLVLRDDKSAGPALEQMVSESPRPQARLHALCTLEGVGLLTPEIVLKGLHDPHPGVRRNAVRIAEPFAPKYADVAEAVLAVANDEVSLQLELIPILGRWNDARAAAALSKIAVKYLDDEFFVGAVICALDEHNIRPVLDAIVFSGLLADKNQAGRAVSQTWIPLAAALGDESIVRDTLRFIRTLDEKSYPDGSDAVFRDDLLVKLLNALERRGLTYSRLLENADASLRAELDLAAERFTAARSDAADASLAEIDRRAALQLLVRDKRTRKEDMALLTDLLGPQHSGSLQGAALERLAALDDVSIPALLFERWKAFGPRVREQAVDVLLARQAWAVALVDALENKTVAAAELSVYQQTRLKAATKPEIRARVETLLAHSVDADRQKVLDAYRPALALAADIKRGKELFGKHCATCHNLEGAGYEVGPDLTTLSDTSPQSLFIAMLDPNRNVEAKFINYVAVTHAGKTHNGLLARELGEAVTLRGPKAEETILLRSELDVLSGTSKSTMPDGLEKDLNQQDVADVIAYVRGAIAKSPGPKPRADGYAHDVRPESDGTLVLKADNCEIYGDTLVLEARHGNLGMWQSGNDRAVWPVSKRDGTRYDVWLEFACDKSAAGNTLVVECGASRLAVKVDSTGTWDAYQKKKVGTIELSPGAQRLSVRADGPIQGALVDLKAIYLTPAAAKTP